MKEENMSLCTAHCFRRVAQAMLFQNQHTVEKHLSILSIYIATVFSYHVTAACLDIKVFSLCDCTLPLNSEQPTAVSTEVLRVDLTLVMDLLVCLSCSVLLNGGTVLALLGH